VNSSTVAVCNGKGGVGKTSLTANIAAEAAIQGCKVLAVDLDVQGNLGLDLRYAHSPHNDEGAGLSQALQFGWPLQPITDVRFGIDCVPGGWHTNNVATILQTLPHDDPHRRQALRRALAPLHSRYDLIIFDTPPGASVLIEIALDAAGGVVIPVKHDGASLDGLTLIGRQYQHVRKTTNPTLRLLGVVLFDTNLRATALNDQIRAELEAALGTNPPVFGTAIRHSQRAAFDMRQEGLTAAEYAAAATMDTKERLTLLRDINKLREAPPARSSAARGLADDYRQLTKEILAALNRGTS